MGEFNGVVNSILNGINTKMIYFNSKNYWYLLNFSKWLFSVSIQSPRTTIILDAVNIRSLEKAANIRVVFSTWVVNLVYNIDVCCCVMRDNIFFLWDQIHPPFLVAEGCVTAGYIWNVYSCLYITSCLTLWWGNTIPRHIHSFVRLPYSITYRCILVNSLL